ncbi:hypothetical protein CCP3SC15_1690003 [Gammaproteobacteria bacterium]
MKDKKKTEIIQVRVPLEIKDKLSELADAETRSLTNMLVVMIEREYHRTFGGSDKTPTEQPPLLAFGKGASYAGQDCHL